VIMRLEGDPFSALDPGTKQFVAVRVIGRADPPSARLRVVPGIRSGIGAAGAEGPSHGPAPGTIGGAGRLICPLGGIAAPPVRVHGPRASRSLWVTLPESIAQAAKAGRKLTAPGRSAPVPSACIRPGIPCSTDRVWRKTSRELRTVFGTTPQR